jgi:competence protein ComEA
MGQRSKADRELARLISDRLALVLADRPPRRARDPDERLDGPPNSLPSVLPYELPDGLSGKLPDESPDEGTDESPDESPDESSDKLPGELSRQRFSRIHVGVVSTLLILGLITAGWLLLRARPVAVASPGDVVTVAGPGDMVTVASPGDMVNTSAPAMASVTPSPKGAKIVVHIFGAVRHPGLVRLRENSRVQDAIDAAGGLTGRADPGELNLAQMLNDGQQVLIGTRSDPAGEVRDQSGSGTAEGPSATGALDLNRADQSQLEELPSVGPVTAQAILTWRQQHGQFSRIEELQEVDGIGPKTYAQIAPHVRV